MTTPAPSEPAKRSRRIYVYWGIALALLLALGLFSWTVVVPVWRTRRIVFAYGRGKIGSEAALKKLGGARQATQRIAQYLHMPEWVREEHTRAMTSDKTASAMYLLTHCGRPAVPVLVRALRDPDYFIRQQAALALMRIGPDAADAVPSLVVALDDENEQVRFNAATALGSIGLPAAEAVPELKRMLTTDKSWASQAAADALQRIKVAQEEAKSD